MSTLAATKKQAVIAAYQELAASQVKVAAAVADFAGAVESTTDAKEVAALIEGGGIPFFAAEAAPQKKGKGKADAGEKEKKVKKIKDPNAPKRPPSAYLEFQNAVRNQYRSEDPNLPYAEVLRKIAAAWASMDDDEKKPFQLCTSEKTAKFEVEKAAYTAAHPDGYHPEGADIDVAGSPEAPKEYTGKKRGRKSAADKLREANEAAMLEGGDIDVVGAIEAAEKKSKNDKKDKKAKDAAKAAAAAPTPKKAAKAKSPTPASSDEDSDSDKAASSSDDDSSESESEDEVPVVAASASKGKKVEKPLKKKAKKD